LIIIILSPDQIEQMVEDFARFMMAKHIPAADWQNFARNVAFRMMSVAGEKASRSGSYKIQYEDRSNRDTLRAPPEPSDPPKKT
jgi:hypothetical protein